MTMWSQVLSLRNHLAARRRHSRETLVNRTRAFMMAIGLAIVALSPHGHAARTVLWDKTVIPIELTVGVEQLLHFDGSVSPGLSPLLSKKDFFRVLSSNGTVYVTALQPFDRQRVKFKTEAGDYILVDMSAITTETPPKSVEDVHIVVVGGRQSSDANPLYGRSRSDSKAPAVSMFDVLRYGAQSLYSPERVIKPVPGINEVTIKIRNNLRGLYKGDNVRSLSIKAVRGWQSSGIYVTALSVKNDSDHPMTFDPSKLQHSMKRVVNGVNNQFEAVALLGRSRHLAGRRQRDNMAFVLVVTDHPFTSVLDI